MDWYYKGGLIVGLIWAAARALGAYGEAARDLDINFLFGFLLTTGGWSAVFLVVDWVGKFLGLIPKRPKPPSSSAALPSPEPTAELLPDPPPVRPASRVKRRRGR